MNQLFNGRNAGVFQYTLIAGGVCLTVFIFALAVQTLLGLRYVGAGIAPTTTITVSGTGNAYVVPNLVEFSYSVVSDKPTVSEAQSEATKKSNEISGYLKQFGIDEKDIKTTGYSIAPRYEWRQVTCQANLPCPSGKQVLLGYEVRQTTDIKVRDTAKSGDLLAGVGLHGAIEVSGLSFTVENPDATQAEARDKAIADAKTKAGVLAKSLGVSLVRIVSFNESNGSYRPPVMYGMEKGMVATDMSASVAPTISVGQNKIESSVSITYEIR